MINIKNKQYFIIKLISVVFSLYLCPYWLFFFPNIFHPFSNFPKAYSLFIIILGILTSIFYFFHKFKSISIFLRRYFLAPHFFIAIFIVFKLGFSEKESLFSFLVLLFLGIILILPEILFLFGKNKYKSLEGISIIVFFIFLFSSFLVPFLHFCSNFLWVIFYSIAFGMLFPIIIKAHPLLIIISILGSFYLGIFGVFLAS